jgi:Ca-activated chloride channel family protein
MRTRSLLVISIAVAVNAAILLGTFLFVPHAPERKALTVRVEEDFVDPLDEAKPELEELPYEESLGKKDFISDAPFDGPSTSSAIGIAGGAGGRFGGRRGRRALRAGGVGWLAPPADREGYDAIDENVFRSPREHPLSTFSIDVDTASMSNVRNLLEGERLPPAGAVRIEEMLNYFDYDYPQPTGEAPFSVTTEVAQCPWNPKHRLLLIGIQGRVMEPENIPPRNLVFLLDVSGSMSSANKLGLVRQAMKLLTAELREEDRVSIVVYAGASGVVLEPTAGSEKQTILAALDRLSAGGSTNAGAGIRLAYDLARKNYDEEGINRVILATDGDFNVGVTSRDELETLIGKQRKSGVFLTVLGVGRGNLKDSQMEMLADKGNGNYAYLDSIAEAEKVLVRDASGTLVTIAKDVKIQVEFNPNQVGSYRLIGYENRKLAARDFNDDRKDAGEIGAGHSVTALYEVTPPEENAAKSSVDPLRYQSKRGTVGPVFIDELAFVKLRYKRPDGEVSRLIKRPVEDPGNISFAATSRDFRFAAAVATFGMALRNSEEGGDASYALASELLAGTEGEDPHGERRALGDLIGRAKALTDH